MPYSMKGSQTRIYPGTIQFYLANPRYNLMSYRCQPDSSSYSINVKPMGAILSAIDFNTDSRY